MKRFLLFSMILFSVIVGYMYWSIDATNDLRLVNEHHPLPRWMMPTNTVTLSPTDTFLTAREITVDPVVVAPLHEMMQRAKSEGLQHFIINSGYRSISEQKELFQQYGKQRAQRAKQSEHHTGLALDIGSTNGAMGGSPEGAWLQQHAWEYGFVMRYPAHKTAITNIQFEPWHIRYVGLPHSLIMRDYDFVLEEYIQYLQDHESLTYGNYTVQRMTKSGYREFSKDRDPHTFTASHDGTGHIIVTMQSA